MVQSPDSQVGISRAWHQSTLRGSIGLLKVDVDGRRRRGLPSRRPRRRRRQKAVRAFTRRKLAQLVCSASAARMDRRQWPTHATAWPVDLIETKMVQWRQPHNRINNTPWSMSVRPLLWLSKIYWLVTFPLQTGQSACYKNFVSTCSAEGTARSSHAPKGPTTTEWCGVTLVL